MNSYSCFACTKSFDANKKSPKSMRMGKSFGYSSADQPIYGKCRDLKHRRIEVSHNRSGSENTVSCPVCKIYWKYDCSG